MSFYYLLGLLGLIGVPVLIIVYIIKNHYTEQTIGSIYLWNLSERFLKKRKPISKVSGIISLILQILAVLTFSLAIAHPYFIIPNSANEFCFIIDGSGSMNIEQDGKTRFEIAKDEVTKIVDGSKNGSKYSVIYVGTSTTILCDQSVSKDEVKGALNMVDAGWMTETYTDALSYAQEYFTANTSTDVYLVTDKAFEVSNNITVLNVADDVENYCLIKPTVVKMVNSLKITGQVRSAISSADLDVVVTVTDSKGQTAQPLTQTVKVSSALTPVDFSFNYAGGNDYSSISIAIQNQDALAEDNQTIIYNVAQSHAYKTLLVSDTPYYLQTVLSVVGEMDIEAIDTSDYKAEMTGYSMYVFDCNEDFTPSELPKDGVVWILNASASIPGAGFSFRSTTEPKDEADYYTLNYSKSSSTLVKSLLSGLTKRDIAVRKYNEYSTSKRFTGLLTENGNNVLFIGTNDNGNREVVFAFDLHDSDITMNVDYLILMKNLLSYSFTSVLDDALYTCGEAMTLNAVAGCSSILVTAPSGAKTHPDISEGYCEVQLTEVGTYLLTVTINGEDRHLSVYSMVPEVESINTTTSVASLQGERTYNFTDGFYDDLLYVFILLAILVLADWGIYCYEQYQLR